MSDIQIKILSKNEIFGESIKTALNQIPDFHAEYIKDYRNNIFFGNNIFFLDISFGNKRCKEIVKDIKDNFPKTKIIIISNHKDRIFYNNLLEAGADDIIYSNSNKNEYKSKIINLLGI